MFKNSITIAWRNLLRNRSFSILNITGLVVGMASAILILLWIQNELSFDQFHTKRPYLYQVWSREKEQNQVQSWATTPVPLGPALQKDIPDIVQFSRLGDLQGSFLLTAGDKHLQGNGQFVDSNFLNLFSFPLLEGEPQTVLREANSMVVTESFAKKLFGDEEAVGKTVQIDTMQSVMITGVLKDLPNNTAFDFEYLLPWSNLRKHHHDDQNWGNSSVQTFVELAANTTEAIADNKIENTIQKYTDDKRNTVALFLHPISKWHLYSHFENGQVSHARIDMVKLFAIIAGFILLIACINFMNLSTARSSKRAKEVGVRKVIGAAKSGLVSQFMIESILLSSIAAAFALLVVQLALPAFNTLVEKQLVIPFNNVKFWLMAVGFVLFSAVLAGSYPAFYLSSFKPAGILKGSFLQIGGAVTPRKVLVVLQFTFAITLIIATIIVHEQIRYAQDRENGYDKNNLAYHFITGDLDKNYLSLKRALLGSGAVIAVNKTNSPLTTSFSATTGLEWKGKNPQDKIDFDRFCADETLGKTVGVQFIAGRDMDLHTYPTDSLAMILNESAVKAMGFKQPLGQLVSDYGRNWHVVGVIKDFIIRSPYDPIRPMVIEGAAGWFTVINMRLNPDSPAAQNLATIERLFKQYNPVYPFELHFVDEAYARKFNASKQTARLAALFAGLTIFISCLGLFGLAAYMAQSRVKEIAVRKVLGASVTNIAALLSRDFLKLVLIAVCIATPAGWWAMHAWLRQYAYRVTIEWWVFALAAVVSLVIALLTVSFQSFKAAIANPVKNLRSE